MNPITVLVMAQNLTKSAALPPLLRRLIARGTARVATSGGLTRALGGAAVGGLAGGLAGGGEGEPEEVAARKKSRILKGALIGAAGGYASPLLTSAGRTRALEGTKNFFARERHGLFGGRVPSTMEGSPQGLTSIPGVVRGLVTKPGEVLRSGWEQGGRWGKAMTVGSALMGARDVTDPNAPGGKAEKAGRLIGETGGYLAGSRLPFLSSMLFSTGTGMAGKYLGRAVDKITGSGQQPAELPQQATP
jgi:hypothetical protein